MENEIVEVKSKSLDIFNDINDFESSQRMAKALSSSNIVPKQYKGQIGDCIIALDLASRMNRSPLEIMQNLHVIQGKPSWSSVFIIAGIESSFDSFEYEFSGKEDTDDWACRIIAKRGTKNFTGSKVSIKMAKKEGWFNKVGSKWQTMPEQMLMYRSATFFGRTYCPSVLMGIRPVDEIEDIESSKVEPKDMGKVEKVKVDFSEKEIENVIEEVKKEESKIVEAEIIESTQEEKAKESEMKVSVVAKNETTEKKELSLINKVMLRPTKGPRLDLIKQELVGKNEVKEELFNALLEGIKSSKDGKTWLKDDYTVLIDGLKEVEL